MSDERLSRIESKLDIVSEKIGSIDSTLAAQHVSLVDHIRRTELLESALKPVEDHVALMASVGKIVAALAVIAAIAEGLMAVLEHVK